MSADHTPNPTERGFYWVWLGAGEMPFPAEFVPEDWPSHAYWLLPGTDSDWNAVWAWAGPLPPPPECPRATAAP